MPAPKIMLLFGVLAVMLVFFGAIVGVLVGNMLVFMSIFFAIAITMNVVSYYKSDSIMLRLTKTKIISRDENPRFYDLVKKVSETAGLPMPKVGIMQSSVPNAFATGRDKNHAVVVATGSILAMLNDDELEGVVGHEISHVTHRDILVSTVAATIATIISYIGNIIIISELFGGINNRNNNAGLLLILSAILIPLGATFVRLGISRSREAYADTGSVELVKKPAALISALQKISKPLRQPIAAQKRNSSPVPSAYSSLFIVNNFGGGALLKLFSTHPSLEARVKNITETAKRLGLSI